MEIRIILCLEASTEQFFRQKLETIEQMLIGILTKETKIMGQIDDVMAEQTVLEADDKALIDAQTQAFKDLEAKIASLSGGAVPPDLAPILARMQTQHAALAQALIDANTADATAQTPPPAAG